MAYRVDVPAVDSVKPSLGTMVIPSGTFEHDLAVGSRYQAFSVEILRVSLAGLGGIGFFLTQDLTVGSIHVSSKPLLIAAAAFGVAAACAIAHRYLGTEALACHLMGLRLRIRNAAGDEAKAKREDTRRKRWFFCCVWLLGWASIATALGAVSVAIGLVCALRGGCS